MKALRRTLDGLYDGAGVLAACFLVAMLVLIVLQMVARWTGLVFRGAPDYAGYCMAAASFLAFAHALNRGAHIRVTLLHQALRAGSSSAPVSVLDPAANANANADDADANADAAGEVDAGADKGAGAGASAGERRTHWLDLWCLLAGGIATTLLAWYAVRAVRWSHKFHDVSQGQDATPLWIPQLGMALGACLLAVCFWDNFLSRLLGGRDNIVREKL